jgi:hypothetical protein
MSKLTTTRQKLHTDHALLALLGHKCQTQKLLEPLHQLLTIPQKTVVHSPTQKLQDCLVTMLMGKRTIYETNTSLSTDPALWQAFGRTGCADQSSIQRTLAACTAENVAQLHQVNAQLLKTNGQCVRHDYRSGPLVIDIDLSGLPCSKHYEGASRGYFANSKYGTTGRQLARASASQYNEIVAQQVFPGNTGSAQLSVLKQLLQLVVGVLAPEAGTGLPQIDKSQWLLRLDGGYGTTEIINYLLSEGYQFVLKLFSSSRAKSLVGAGRCGSEQIPTPKWHSDQCHQREYVVLDSQANSLYQVGQQPLVQIGLRCVSTSQAKLKTKTAALKPEPTATSYGYTVLLVSRPGQGSLTAEQARQQLHFYDERVAIETASFAADKQGLGIAKRRKRSLVGQEILLGLAQLAHNLVIWLRNWLAVYDQRVNQYGIKRWVRDWLAIKGRVSLVKGQIVKVRLVSRHEMVRQFFNALKDLFAQSGVRLILHQC